MKNKKKKKQILSILLASSLAITCGCPFIRKEKGYKVGEIDGCKQYECTTKELAEEVIANASTNGNESIDFNSIINYQKGNIVSFKEQAMYVGYDFNLDGHLDKLYFSDLDIEAIAKQVFASDYQQISIQPYFMASKTEDKYQIVLAGLSANQTDLYNGTNELYKEEGFTYNIYENFVFGSSSVTKEEAEKLFTKYLNVYVQMKQLGMLETVEQKRTLAKNI